MAAVTICSDFGAPQNKVWHCFHCFPIYFPWSDGTSCHDLCLLSPTFSFMPVFVPVGTEQETLLGSLFLSAMGPSSMSFRHAFWELSVSDPLSLCPYLICCPVHLEYNFWVRKIPWRRKWPPTQYSCLEYSTEEPGRLQSMELQGVGHNWATNTHTIKILYVIH